MQNGSKVIVVLPAYNAAKTLEKVFREIPEESADEVILVDDFSSDETSVRATELGIKVVRHKQNRGYGANQKTCYSQALQSGADIIIMLHPDYQYTPKLIPVMASMISSGLYDIVLGSRILGGKAVKGGMPIYKYISNRILTLIQNMFLGAKLSEYHTGYRAFSRKALSELNFTENSDGFIFDNELLCQAVYKNYRIGEISCPTKYEPESSTISFGNSVRYGIGCIMNALLYRLAVLKIYKAKIYRQ